MSYEFSNTINRRCFSPLKEEDLKIDLKYNFNHNIEIENIVQIYQF